MKIRAQIAPGGSFSLNKQTQPCVEPNLWPLPGAATPIKAINPPTPRAGEVWLCLDLKNQIKTALQQRWTPLVAAGSREEPELGEPSGPKGLGWGFEQTGSRAGTGQGWHGLSAPRASPKSTRNLLGTAGNRGQGAGGGGKGIFQVEKAIFWGWRRSLILPLFLSQSS